MCEMWLGFIVVDLLSSFALPILSSVSGSMIPVLYVYQATLLARRSNIIGLKFRVEARVFRR